MSKRNRATDPQQAACPCGSGQAYPHCCGALHAGAHVNVFANSALALMRSRYSAYALGCNDYLLATWHPSTRPATLDLHEERNTQRNTDLPQSATHLAPTTPATQWIGLQIRRDEPGDEEAIVEFIARYRIGGRAQRLHEISHFVRENGRWYYLKAENEPD